MSLPGRPAAAWIAFSCPPSPYSGSARCWPATTSARTCLLAISISAVKAAIEARVQAIARPNVTSSMVATASPPVSPTNKARTVAQVDAPPAAASATAQSSASDRRCNCSSRHFKTTASPASAPTSALAAAST